MWDFFIKNNRFSFLLITALVGLGVYAVIAIPKESSPEVEIPVGTITTILPGAPAADVEKLITNELERGLIGSLSEVKEITSLSREGVSSITVEFDASADIDESIADLKDEIDSLTPDLPTDAEDPVVTKVDFVDQPIMSVAFSAPLDPYTFSILADEIEAELESVPGVSRTSISGVRAREVSVLINQTALQQFSLSLNDVTAALRAANTAFPIGQIESNNLTYNVAFEGDIPDTEAVLNVAITTRGDQPVYIRDIAEVIDGLEPSTSLSRLSVSGAPSEQAVVFDIFKQSGGDITQITDAVLAKIETLETPDNLLDGVIAETTYNAGQDIKDDLIQLSGSGLQTVILVMIVLILAIGWREAFIAGAAIPLSFLLGFIGLYYSGNTINFLSLFALILGIGILVDSGIVMVEGINRRMKEDLNIDKKQAAIDTIYEFKNPLIAGTLTTVSMFAGLFIVSGVTGQFIASIPFTLVFVLFASLFVAIVVLPLFSATFLKRRSATRLEQAQVAYSRRLEHWYKTTLRAYIEDRQKQRRFQWTIRILLIIALLLPAFGLVRVVFFEQGDSDFIYAEIDMPVGTTQSDTDLAARRLEEVLYSNEAIRLFQTTVGAGSQFGSGGSGNGIANIFISLSDEREEASSEIVSVLQKQVQTLPDLDITISQPNNGPPTGAPINLRFTGEDLVVLGNLANQSAQLLQGIDGTTNVETSANENGTEFVLNFKRDEAAFFGLTSQAVSSFVRSAVYGTDATSITTLNDDINIVVKLELAGASQFDPADTNQVDIATLEQLLIPTPAGETVPLSSIVDISLRESSSVIQHIDGERVVSISGDVTDGTVPADVQSLLLSQINEQLVVPDDVTISTGGGEAEESNQAFIELFAALVVGIMLMVGVLVLQFNSFLHTRYVLSILPYSLIGIMFGLAITGNSLSFPSIMGFIALSGIVVNNSILLIDMMNSERLAKPDKAIIDVVVDAAGSRLRPILLTTLTTVMGMIPLTYADDIWAPLAYAVMFGLIFSVVITLVLIPIIYTKKPGSVN